MKSKIAILGGGISGLAAAWRLSRLAPNAEIVLFERSERLGGYIETVTKNGMIFEKGPRTFRSSHCPALLNLIKEVGLEKDLIFSNSASSKRYLWHQGALRSVSSLLLPHAWRLLFAPFIPKSTKEESVYGFMKRRYGTKIADLFADPLCLGIYAGNCHTLSVNACFPFLKGLSPIPSKKRFPGSLFTLKKGMYTLIEALHQNLPIEIRTHSEVTAIKKRALKWEVFTQQDCFPFDFVFSALPFPSLHHLIPELAPIEVNSLWIANLGFSNLDVPYQGYGYLVPTREQHPLLGMIWDSNIFPQQSGIRFTAMIRSQTDSPKEVLYDALQKHLGIFQKPDFLEFSYIQEGIPQYGLGHRKILALWEKTLSEIPLLGAHTSGVSVEQCLLRAESAVADFLIKNKFHTN